MREVIGRWERLEFVACLRGPTKQSSSATAYSRQVVITYVSSGTSGKGGVSILIPSENI